MKCKIKCQKCGSYIIVGTEEYINEIYVCKKCLRKYLKYKREE